MKIRISGTLAGLTQFGWLLALFLPFAAGASDWPQFLGPTRNAVYAGPPLADEWPQDGPHVVWHSAIGEGYSSPVASGGCLIVCHRVGAELLVTCFEALTGKTNWVSRSPMQFRDGEGRDSGPRPTPAINGDKVFVCNTDGLLACLDLKDGATIWSRRTKREFNSTATWHGFVASPLVIDRAVILPVGGTNSGIVAFDGATGKVLWKGLPDKASASSPLLANIDGKSQLLVVTRSAIHALDPENGNEYWSLPTRRQTTGDLYAASPVVFGNYLFVSGCYRLGAQLLQIEHGRPKELWHLDDSLNTHLANAIPDGGFLYGFHGHAGLPEGRKFRCIEVATGKVLWEQEQSAPGTILRTGRNLVLLLETGELQLVQATPKGLRVLSRAQVVGKPTRTYPAIVDGYAFIKGPNTLVCLDLRLRK